MFTLRLSTIRYNTFHKGGHTGCFESSLYSNTLGRVINLFGAYFTDATREWRETFAFAPMRLHARRCHRVVARQRYEIRRPLIFTAAKY